MRLVSDNKISKAWAFLFQNLEKKDERNISRPKVSLHTVIETAHY